MIFEPSAALARRSSTNRRNPPLHESRATPITLRPGVTLPCPRRTAAIVSRSAITAFVVVYRPSLTGKRARAALASRIPRVTSASVALPMPYSSAWRTMSLWLITFWRSVRCAIAQATASLAGLAAFGSQSTNPKPVTVLVGLERWRGFCGDRQTSEMSGRIRSANFERNLADVNPSVRRRWMEGLRHRSVSAAEPQFMRSHDLWPAARSWASPRCSARRNAAC